MTPGPSGRSGGDRPPDLFDMAAAEELTPAGAARHDFALSVSTRWSVSAICWLPARRCRALVEEDRLARPSSSGRQARARRPSPGCSPSTRRGARGLSAVDAGREGRPQRARGRPPCPRRRGAGNDPVPRRGAPVQQGPTRRPPPRRRGGPRRAVGATTENPFFALNAPLLSRSTLWRFEALTPQELRELAERALRVEGFGAAEGALVAPCRPRRG